MTREEFVRFVRGATDRLERHLRAAAAITGELGTIGLRPVVVWGSAVEFYTRGAYATADIDLIAVQLMASHWDELDWSYLSSLAFQEDDPRYVRVEQEARELADRLHRPEPPHQGAVPSRQEDEPPR